MKTSYALDSALEQLSHAWRYFDADEFNETPEMWPPTVSAKYLTQGGRAAGAYALAAAIGTIKRHYDEVTP